MLVDIVLPEDARMQHHQNIAQFHETGQSDALNRRVEITALRRNGEEFPAELSIVPFHTAQGHYLTAFISDISERQKAHLKLQLAASVFTHANEGIMITTTDGTIMDVNFAFCAITGYQRDEVLGKTPRILKSNRQDQAFYDDLWRSLKQQDQWSGEVWNRRKNGEVFPEMLNISAVRDEHGRVKKYVALFSDITQRKQMEEQIRQLAFYDELTQLPNRRMLQDRLGQALSSNRRSNHFAALMFLDMDNFKPLNDTHGHAVGDLLLIEVAHRLTNCVRESDTVARMGGDEFVVMLGELDTDLTLSTAQAQVVANKILLSLSSPYLLTVQREGGEPAIVEHHCTTSIGVAMLAPAQTDQDTFLKQADAAMYQAKEAGRNCIRFYQV